MKTVAFSFAAALLVAVLPLGAHAAPPTATQASSALPAASAALAGGKLSAPFMDFKKGARVKVAGTPDGSRVDLIAGDGSKTIHFYFNPVTTSWPREIERVVEEYHPSGTMRGGYSHGEVTVTNNVATFKGNGFVPVGKFSFTVQ
jgi:hypothetical protein